MNIVVVGGGTAGWLAALFISKLHPNHNVTVVASKEIGVIGAGEAVTGALTDVIVGHYGDFGIDPAEFCRETSAMPKYGILHKDWTSKKGFDYFGPIDGTLTSLQMPDSIIAYLASQHPDKVHMGAFFGQMYDSNISPISKITNNIEVSTHAFHFDAKLVAQYLEKHCLKSPNCSLIDAKILDANLDEQGFIKSLLLENQTTVNGDFFIDASGFKRILMKKLETKWVDYKKHLPVNAALPFFLDYDKGEEPKCYSTAWAQSSGWYWEANIQSRKGCGYTFCDDFITADQAQAEIETTLGRKITPINYFKFETGRLENTWVKNCLAIGLAGAFAEPLEATSIHSTIVQLSHLCFEFLKPTKEDTLNPGSILFYNTRVNTMFDDFKDFLVAHYLGGRTDSEFWRYITAGNTLTDFTKNLKETCKSRLPTKYDFSSYHGAAPWAIWSFILVGTGQISPEVAYKHLTKDVIQEAVDELNKLTISMEKLRLTHYSFDEYRNIINNNNVKFMPKRGVEWHVGLK
jgi:tryptophan halogenase